MPAVTLTQNVGIKKNSHSAVCTHWLPFPSTGGHEMMTGQNSSTWDKGTILNLMGTFLPGWCCGHLRTLSFIFWGFLRYFWKEVRPFPFRWLGTSHSWTQAVVLQSSSAPSTQAPPRPKQRRTKLGTESPPLHMLDYQQVGPFSSWGHVHKVCSCLLEQFTWRKRSHWLMKIWQRHVSLHRTWTWESHYLYYFQMCLGKEMFKTKTDTSSTFIIQLQCLFFIDVNALLGVLILICLTLIFFINAISPKGVYDFRPFICHHQLFILSLWGHFAWWLLFFPIGK